MKVENWSKKLFKKAFTTVVTRCFGWSMPSTMVVPVADNLNHFILDSSYELFQADIHQSCVSKDAKDWSAEDKNYATEAKMLLKCQKFYDEDAQGVTTIEEDNICKKTKRYGQKVALRHEA